MAKRCLKIITRCEREITEMKKSRATVSMMACSIRASKLETAIDKHDATFLRRFKSYLRRNQYVSSQV